MKARLRQGSVPCQAVSGSGRVVMDGPRRQPHRPPLASGFPSKALTRSMALAGTIPSRGSAVPRAGGRWGRAWEGVQQEMGKHSLCPVAHGAPFWGLWSIGGWQETLSGPEPGREGLCVAPVVAPVPADPRGSEPGGSGDGSNAVSVPAGWWGGTRCPHGWRHRPGRPEALC